MTDTDRTTKQILIFLTANGHACWRQNQGSHHRRRMPDESRGVADVLAVIRPIGRLLEVEVKTGADRPSKYQIAHALRVQASGGWHIFASTFDDFEEQFRKLRTSRLT